MLDSNFQLSLRLNQFSPLSIHLRFPGTWTMTNTSAFIKITAQQHLNGKWFCGKTRRNSSHLSFSCVQLWCLLKMVRTEQLLSITAVTSSPADTGFCRPLVPFTEWLLLSQTVLLIYCPCLKLCVLISCHSQLSEGRVTNRRDMPDSNHKSW